MEVFHEFTFEAAHRLPAVPDGHKCARLHGHSYRVLVTCAGAVTESQAWGIDFADIKDAMAPLLDRLDHHTLNDVDGLANPTAERLAQWIWERLPLLPLSAVTVRETAHAGCTYRGET